MAATTFTSVDELQIEALPTPLSVVLTSFVVIQSVSCWQAQAQQSNFGLVLSARQTVSDHGRCPFALKLSGHNLSRRVIGGVLCA